MPAHRALLAAAGVVAVAAPVLAAVLTPWWLLALPACLVASCVAWLGAERFLSATGDVHDDPGRGTPGLLP